MSSRSNTNYHTSTSRIRRSTSILRNDAKGIESTDRDVHFKVLLHLLRALEPATRLFAFKSFALISASTIVSSCDMVWTIELVKSLHHATVAEESMMLRCAAAQALSNMVAVMLQPGFPYYHLDASFHAVLDLFLSLFPSELGPLLSVESTPFDTSHYTPPHIFMPRLSVLQSLAAFWKTEPAQSVEFISYMDAFTSSVLSSTSTTHPYLQAAVLRVVNQQLPQTNRNRIRVDKFIAKPLFTMLESYLEDKRKVSSSQANSNAELDRSAVKSTAHLSSSRTQSVSVDAKTGRDIHPLLLHELGRYWARWYSRPSDSILVNIDQSPEEMARLGFGFSIKRWQYLKSLGVFEQTFYNESDEGKAVVRKVKARGPYYPDDVPDLRSLKLGIHGSCLVVRSRKSRKTGPSSSGMETLELTLDSKSSVEVPDPAAVCFNVDQTSVTLLRNSREVFLHNRSLTKDVEFTLQAVPQHLFKATPMFGLIPRGESFLISVEFCPRPDRLARNLDVHGFLRVRNSDGFAMDRLSLRGFNAPVIKTWPPQLDFGCCPKGEVRTLPLCLQNVLPVETTIILVIAPSSSSEAFTVVQSQFALQPRERRVIQVKLTSSSDNTIKDRLIVVAMGGELHEIVLLADGRDALRVLETEIDFGPTDIYYGAAKKRITLQNRDLARPLHVLVESSTNELVLNHGHTIVVPPGGEERVVAEFLSCMSGQRQETLTLRVPSSAPINLEVVAFSGPALLIPIFETVCMPITLVDRPTVVAIPLINLSAWTIQCQVVAPNASPFKFDVVDRNPGVSFQALDGQAVGAFVTLAPRAGFLLQVTFTPSSPGTYRYAMNTQMMKPRKWQSYTHQFVGVAVTPDYISRAKPLQGLRRYLDAPLVETPATASNMSGTSYAPTADGDLLPTSVIFEVDPPIQSVIASTRTNTFEDTYQFVSITNLTSSSQAYHLVLSYPFMTDVPLDGILEAAVTAEIPIRIHERFERETNPETRHYTIFGTLAIFDDNFHGPGMVSVGLQGVFGDLLKMELREGAETIKFPNSKPMHKAIRKLIIRNKANFEVAWEARVTAIGQKGIGLAADGFPLIVPSSMGSEWCPFGLSSARVTLKPFECTSVDVYIQSSTSSDHRARIFPEYIDPVAHVVNGDTQRGKTRRSLAPFTVECTVGAPELATSPDSFDFGDVVVGRQAVRTLAVLNTQPFEITATLIIPHPFHASQMTVVVPRNSRAEVSIIFEPTKAGQYCLVIHVMSSHASRSIPVMARSGISSLNCDLVVMQALPSPIPAPSITSHLGQFPSNVSIPRGPPIFGTPLSHQDAPSQAGLHASRTSHFHLAPQSSHVGGIAASRRGSMMLHGSQNEELQTTFVPVPIIDTVVKDEKSILDLGIVELGSTITKTLTFRNNGNFDYQIKEIRVTADSAITWKIINDDLEDSTILTLPSKDVVKFGEEPMDAMEIDWDEAEYRAHQQQRQAALDAKGATQSTDPKNLRRRVGGKLKMPAIAASSAMSAAAAAIATVAPHANGLPLRLAPSQYVMCIFTFSSSHLGNVTNHVQVEVERIGSIEVDSYAFWMSAMVQPPLKVRDKRVEFGIRHVHDVHKTHLLFSNTGDLPVSWDLSMDQIEHVALTKYETQHMSSMDLTTIPAPFSVFPNSGTLPPKCTQSVDVYFNPSAPQHEVWGHYTLHAGNLTPCKITVHGVGASSVFVADANIIDFDIIRVGMTKAMKVRIRNRGILQSRFFVECNNDRYMADPEEGTLEADGTIELSIKFTPRNPKEERAFIKISPRSDIEHLTDALIVEVVGTGSYPEIFVLTRTVDFAVALFGQANTRPITIENRGSAEASLTFTCHHRAIQLRADGSEPNDEVILPPKSIRDIDVVYTPTAVETLNAKVFLKSSDSRGDFFMVALKGTVGIPRLTFDPPDALESLDFGVCLVHRTYKKTFKLHNIGNINLSCTVGIESKTPIPESDRDVIQVELSSGVVAVGATVDVIITFKPTRVADYTQSLRVNYDFRSILVPVKGCGGKSMLHIDSPLRSLDFGICRLRRVFRKSITVSNRGNLAAMYHVRPEPADRDWKQVEASFVDEEAAAAVAGSAPSSDAWVEQLAAAGYRVINADVLASPSSKVDVVIEFRPSALAPYTSRIRVYVRDQYEEFDIRGRGAEPLLQLLDADGLALEEFDSLKPLELGVHPVNADFIKTFQLKNEGPFPIDYLLQPSSIREFDIHPQRGIIAADSTSLLHLVFRPTTENRFRVYVKVMWEKDPLKLIVTGQGGIGKLEVNMPDEKDARAGGLDFGIVPFGVTVEKRFYLLNVGLVPNSIHANVDNRDFAIAQMAEPFLHRMTSGQPLKPPMNKRSTWNWVSEFRMILAPGMAVEIGAQFAARAASAVTATIQIQSENSSNNPVVGLRGKGGTISISHIGDLSFGEVASCYTYTRKLTIQNAGSIATPITLDWAIVGHSSEARAAFIPLSETFISSDPRSGWARIQYLKDRGVSAADVPKYKMSSDDLWGLIRKMVCRLENPETLRPWQSRQSVSTRRQSLWGNTINRIHNYLHDDEGDTSETPAILRSVADVNAFSDQRQMSEIPRGMSIIQPFAISSEDRDNPGADDVNSSRMSISGRTASVPKKRILKSQAAFVRRRQMFFHLITNQPMSSQVSAVVKPYIKVEPATTMLPSFGEVSITVEINLASEDSFMATLNIRPAIASFLHEIALAATPRSVLVHCNDSSPLNFYRQPLGQPEIISRTFTNVGHKAFSYFIHNPVASLSVMPTRGALKAGQSVIVDFTFKAAEEAMQTGDVIFEPDCSQPIRLKTSGGGGVARASLSKYRRFDFGHCMIGKNTVSYLPITNEGNAMLHLTRFELFDNDTFTRGKDWPTTRVSLFPGKTFNLAVVFTPSEDSPPPGRLIIGTISENWDVELAGQGREAVLIISRMSLEFSEALVGNSYEQKLALKNVGEVNYPVSFKLEKDFPDIEFNPPAFVLHPFSDSHVGVVYTPSRETRQTVTMIVSSPYSTHKVPLSLHAGTVMVDFSCRELDFGMFEKTTSPTINFSLKNTGSVRTSYSVRDVMKPSMFHITGGKGMLAPGKSAEVQVTHTRHQVGQFAERLMVKTDLIDKPNYLKVSGQCEEAVLKPEEFAVLNMGTCPVLETTVKILSFTNYGKYPLEYTIKTAYPLKASPTSGYVIGNETAKVAVAWCPSGGYELRTQLQIETNIGSFGVSVRGKAALPELVLSTTYIDFGVGAVGTVYRETLEISNKGKVGFTFNIPPIRDPAYSVSLNSAAVIPKKSIVLDVEFKPQVPGRVGSSFMVECAGINYKEVVLIGVGGLMKLDISPPIINLGRCPYDEVVHREITFTNVGEVSLAIRSKGTSIDVCEVACPEVVLVKAGSRVRTVYGITCKTVGSFQSVIQLLTKEGKMAIPIHGVGVRISLSERAKDVLENERLLTVQKPSPFAIELPLPSELEGWLKADSRLIRLDLAITSLVSQVMQQNLLPPSSSTDKEGVAAGTKPADLPPPATATSNESLSSSEDSGTSASNSKESLQDIQSKDYPTSVAIRKDIQEILVQFVKKESDLEASDMSRVIQKFWRLKSDEHLQIEPDFEDFAAYELSQYQYVAEEIDASDILRPVEPRTIISLDPMLVRPPPFLHDDTVLAREGGKSKKYSDQFSPLKRSDRNAKTVDFYTK
ncbi:hypothetical protein SmJEL517_g05513 [Synchytrium microbalum]|uniref:HYDIN/VesB/CFA65-like Ig-like domain-containing protein n=1 Tax=Synchytrium microbalum TaxID=1806994 RepID=A0A507C0E7_9FUNG|nr:uncharacterized protein SmJEL517_g05513 [Synchytrium microbalum]TPX31055.1 hypothetical protein SmJEL517_g05513 [Synchytrium microbalum]